MKNENLHMDKSIYTKLENSKDNIILPSLKKIKGDRIIIGNIECNFSEEQIKECFQEKFDEMINAITKGMADIPQYLKDIIAETVGVVITKAIKDAKKDQSTFLDSSTPVDFEGFNYKANMSFKGLKEQIEKLNGEIESIENLLKKYKEKIEKGVSESSPPIPDRTPSNGNNNSNKPNKPIGFIVIALIIATILIGGIVLFNFFPLKNSNEGNSSSSSQVKSSVPFSSSSESSSKDASTYYEDIFDTPTRYSCVDGNGYDKSNPDPSPDMREWHYGYEIGQLSISGCKRDDGNYKILNNNDFNVKYNITMDINNLPAQGNASETKIWSDGSNSVVGTNINSTIGTGAYYVKIHYSNGTYAEKNETNVFLKNGSENYFNLVTSSDFQGKQIKKIDVVIVYELTSGAPGDFFGAWWWTYSNWRLEYTYNFV